MHKANLAVMVAVGGEPAETSEIIYELLYTLDIAVVIQSVHIITPNF